jgi:hypothetical protein
MEAGRMMELEFDVITAFAMVSALLIACAGVARERRHHS